MKKEARTLVLIAAVIVFVGIVGTLVYRKSNSSAPEPPKNTPNVAEALVRPDSASLGPETAKVTVVEFFDPECEGCAKFDPVVKSLIKEYPQIRFVFRYMPFHRNARLAASYIEAAGEQGKYFEMKDLMFQKQNLWGEIHGAAPPPDRLPANEVFDKFGEELGLNVEQLRTSAQDPKHVAKADRDLNDGRVLGVRQTPTFFVNGRKLLKFSEQDLRSLIKEELDK